MGDSDQQDTVVPGTDSALWGQELFTRVERPADWCTVRQAQEHRNKSGDTDDQDERIKQAAAGIIVIDGLSQSEAQQLLDVRNLLRKKES
jgi:hypothetical protein